MFTEICATSASTWEKSGLTVPSIARLALGVHFTSTPASSSTGSFTKPADGSAGSRGTPDSFAVTKGAATRWEAEGSPVSPGQLPGPADEAVAAARDRARMDGVAVLARVVPPDEDSPRLRVRLRVPERRERDPELGLPPLVRHAGGRVVEEVRGEVLVPVRVVEHGVALDPARVHPQLHGRPPVVPGVEQDRDVVVGADDVVPVDVRGPDLPRLRVVALHRDVEVPVVVRHPGRRLHLRRHVVARIRFPERVDDRGALPARVPEIAVHGHRTGGPRHGNRRRKTRLRPGRQGADRRATGRRGPDGFSAWKATPERIRARRVEVPARYRPSCGGTRFFVACSNA